MRRLKVLLFIGTLFIGSLSRAETNSSKEFITSVTYGVLAGTLVGVASLAFTSNPGENLNKIARGASLGLYLGIGLGLYVVYGGGDENPESVRYVPKTFVYPLISERGVEGAAATWNALSW